MNAKASKIFSTVIAFFIILSNVTIANCENLKADIKILKLLPKGTKILKIYEKDINCDEKNETIVTFYSNSPKICDGFMVLKKCKNNKSNQFIKLGQTVKYNFNNIKVYFGDIYGDKDLEILTLNTNNKDDKSYVDVYYISKNFMQKAKYKDKLSCDSLKLVNLTDNQGTKDEKTDIVICDKNQDTGETENHIYKMNGKAFINCDSKFPPYTESSINN